MSDAKQTQRGAGGNGDDYWNWDSCKWGTHRVNCFPGDCPFRVYSKDGRVVREEVSCAYPGFSDPNYRLPDFNPRGCQKGYVHSRAMYGPDRVLYPMKRAGERGSGKWQRIEWEQAFDEIGAKVAEVIAEHGPQALIDDHGTNGAGLVRGATDPTITALMTLLGGVSFDMWSSIGDFNVGQYLTFGHFMHAPGIENWFLADTIVVIGNPVYADIADMHYLLEARYRGAKVAVIAPDKSPTAQFADLWLPIDWSADPALWLGVCRILIESGGIDSEFVAEQTDAAVLVRGDDGRFLRDSDLSVSGDPEQYYAIDADTGKPGKLPKGTLRAPFKYALEGSCRVRLKNGSETEVVTVFSLLKARAAEYTPERVHQIAGIHPDQLKQLADLCRPPRKVFALTNWNAGKLYHGDLLERSFCCMLALTGNIGKPGTGCHTASGGAEGGCSMPSVTSMPREVLESADPMLETINLMQQANEDYKTRVSMDPTMPPMEAAAEAQRAGLRQSGTVSSAVWLWYYHSGYREVWDKHLDDPSTRKKISAFAEEAIANNWWQGFDRPARNVTPRVMFVSGGNPIRRHRGGMNTMLKTLWPKLDLIAVLETRWSTTGLLADYVLPAASYYEYAETKSVAPQIRIPTFTDRSVPMQGESKSDRQIVLGIVRAAEAHLKRRGISKYKSGDREVVVDELYWRATYGGHYGDSDADEERMLDDTYRAMGRMGWYTSVDGEEMSLENMRRNGMAYLSGRPNALPIIAQNADLVPGQVHYPFRDQVEQKVPYPSTTRRIELYLDHPWFIEADEQLIRYKQPPFIAGHHPQRITSGHVRWSVHGVYHTTEEMLKLHRGEPFAFINSETAAEKRISDNDYIRVFNDYGECLIRAKQSPCVRRDQVIIYDAWDPYQHPNWISHCAVLPGPVKGLHFAGGYRHYQYNLFNWSPQQADRQTNVSFEKANYQIQLKEK